MYVALVGPPNSGKTTLFNWLTGRNQKVVNYPGSTVDLSIGPLLSVFAPADAAAAGFMVLDTPGTYSLFPKSPDEEVTYQALFDGAYDINKVILVLDSTQIARQVHLVRQLQEGGFAVVVAVTMNDLHLKEQSHLDAQRFSALLGAPVCLIDGTLGGGVKELVAEVNRLGVTDGRRRLEPWPLDKLQRVFREGEKIAAQVAPKKLDIFRRTEVRDRIFLHTVFGPIIFGAVMLALFSSIYWAAAPAMDIVDQFFGWSAETAKNVLGVGLFSDFISDGVITGLGAVLIFVPQIFILFIGISILEDTGYLARAATLIDKPLSKFGLNGKAFVPILSGFACAVPAMMAARAVNSRKERWIAMFIIPFMTCSARLPVYALLLAFLFSTSPLKAGAGMAALYVGGLLVGAITAGVLNKIIKSKTPSFFLLELPIYRRPKWAVIFRNSYRRTKSYVVKTAPIILVLAVALWVLSTFPNYKEADSAVRLQTSYAADVGHVLEPVFRPMGVDWRVGVGLISAFAARETFVAAMAVMFNITDTEDEDRLSEGLLTEMRAATFADGTPIFTTASVIGLLLFFMIALQCISTTATAKQEMRSTGFAILQLVVMNLLAYAAAVVAYSVIS